MDTNLNNTSFYVIILCFMIFVGCSYFFYQKIKKLNETIGQLQKHVMYQQTLIEKHSLLLRNTGTNINPNEIIQEIPVPIFENETKKMEENPPQQEEIESDTNIITND